ncbi:enoyl-CoA hydratase/isomerase family protein [Leptolyngbya sp. 7M]|uniref:enoyl-CoA hydratase/isomerase family protein n=1 Tax=Leptolyngbya sp. 7M TaxID=2812896 RepID=UPI001B8A8EDA|nr:enoyl-CoA hydratase-related protein [Leptolyngbya sp. 7M]QYO66231.1 enoyl-CoA hydratase/isomerase family protein [Leptolyngbya sp. 7M]
MPVVLTSTEDAVHIITLNRPDKRNALNDELIDELKTALRYANDDDSLRAVVIRGAGKDFCSGADLSSIQKIATATYEENLEDARSLAELFSLIREVRVPVIAAVHGRALAGGCGLATACDLVIATKSARFGYPEVKIGFVPAMVSAIVRRNIGEKKSFELLTQGFEYSAQEAESLGLVNKVFEDEDFETSQIEYASVYSRLSPSAVSLCKSLLYKIDGTLFREALEFGAATNAQARMTDDCQNGIRAFLERDRS